MATCLLRLKQIFLDGQDPPVTGGGKWYFQGFNPSEPANWGDIGSFSIGQFLGGINYSLDIELPSLAGGGFINLEYRVEDGPANCVSSTNYILEILPLCATRTANGVPFVELDFCFNPVTGLPDTADAAGALGDPACGGLTPGGTWELISASPVLSTTLPEDTIDQNGIISLVNIMADANGPGGGANGLYLFRYDISNTATYPTAIDADFVPCERCFGEVRLSIVNQGNIPYIGQIANPSGGPFYGEYTNPVIVGQDPGSVSFPIGSGNNVEILNWNAVFDFAANGGGSVDYVYYGEGPDVGGVGTNPDVFTQISGAITLRGSQVAATIPTPLNAGDRIGFVYPSIPNPTFISTTLSPVLDDLPQGIHAFHICNNAIDPQAPPGTECNACGTVYVNSVNFGPPYEMTIAFTPEQCVGANDGTITVNSVTGGTPPYEYSINGGPYQSSPTFTGLAPNQAYNITVRDSNGDTYMQVSPVIPAAVPLTVTGNVIASDPQNQTYTLQQLASGGNPPYLYSDLTVNNGGQNYEVEDTYANLQSDQTYTLGVIDSNGCLVTVPFTYDVSPDFTDFTLSTTPVLCNGDSNGVITITGTTGGVGPFEYRILQGGSEIRTWRNINNPWDDLPAGTYSAEVRDSLGEVLSSGNFSVAQPGVLVLSGEVFGSNLILSTTGGSGTKLYSSDGVNYGPGIVFPAPTNPGTYTYYVQDANGCVDTWDYVLQAITDASVTTENVCLPDQGRIVFDPNNVVGGTPPYQFSISGNNTYSSTQVYLVNAGTYDCWVKDSVGATYQIGNVTIQQAAIPLSMSVNQTAAGEVTINVVGGQAPYEYNVNSTDIVPGSGWTTNPVFGSLVEGNTYYFFVRDSYGCIESAPITIAGVNQADVYVDGVVVKISADSLSSIIIQNLTINGDTVATNEPAWDGSTLTASEYQFVTSDPDGHSVQMNIAMINTLNDLVAQYNATAPTPTTVSFEPSPYLSCPSAIPADPGAARYRHIRVTWLGNETWSLDLGGSMAGAIFDSTLNFQGALDSVSYNQNGGTLTDINSNTYNAATHYADSYCNAFGGVADNPFAYVPG